MVESMPEAGSAITPCVIEGNLQLRQGHQASKLAEHRHAGHAREVGHVEAHGACELDKGADA
eukprot:CAMPEP_0197923872 /NCGR_PEP_ID=MMETSP1439-20131203/94739_1 /TAXON_ID=66791 /ORGANISM="Gonyaulax spinifera, Strain CCMP409" /LENGTH=61 /DNA_ID=CAMNT_0043546269 /DNA_START=32 /DNA_END=217 /DNA_ORIENTATION=-